MNIKDNDSQCMSCQNLVEPYDGIYVTHENECQYLCSSCYNESISEYLGLNYEHISFDPITLKDKDGIDHVFHFRSRLSGDMIVISAFEMHENIPKGYESSVMGDAEDDLFNVFKILFERIRRAMNQKHIRKGDLHRYQITDENIVRGHITWDENGEQEAPLLVIDGKEISWDEFGKMVMSYEGFNFKMEIFDETEER